MQEVALYGTQVVKVTSTYDQAKALAAEFAAAPRLLLRPRHDQRGLGEIDEDDRFRDRRAAREPGRQRTGWRAPDWYVQAVSGGLGPYGVLKGFRELHAMGLIDHLPRLAVIQAEGCDPMVRAWKAEADVAEPIVPTTRIYTLSTGDPGRGYTLLRRRMLEASGGAFESVSDDEAIQAMHHLAKMEGLSAEPAAGVAFAGLIRLAHQGVIGPDETVVVNLSGHSMPVEEEALGEGWYRDLTSRRVAGRSPGGRVAVGFGATRSARDARGADRRRSSRGTPTAAADPQRPRRVRDSRGGLRPRGAAGLVEHGRPT